jgi:hypothetical protein
MKTYMELRVNSKDDARVLLIVTCADETLVAQEMLTGTEGHCIDYVEYYGNNGMEVVTVYNGSMTKYNQD